MMERHLFHHKGKKCENRSKPDTLKIYIQGEKHEVKTSDIGPTTSLNDYLRHNLFLKGTKRMCNEGGCGACVVAVTKPGDSRVLAVNSCLLPILTCHEWKIETVEGIGNPLTSYHPVQKTLEVFNGTQCGYCSPGMVMNMYALYENGKPTMEQVENSFGGNICRCTGYRPIMSAFKSLCKDASPALIGRYPDIEDVVCLKSRVPKDIKKFHFTKDRKTLKFSDNHWTKVHNLKDLLAELSNIGNKPYMLIAGNTAKGVYKLPTPRVYIDVIQVEELITYKLDNEKLTLGGNMSLTNVMELFFELSEQNKKFAHLKIMANHIDLIANVPVRNTGTMAGNLMMKHLFHQFPSDIFLILETFGAKLIIMDTTQKVFLKSLKDFLGFDMDKKIIRGIEIPCLSNQYKYESYKIMPRAQNAHAIINAGFLYKLDSSNRVEEATIVFGNINPSFIHATETEKFLLKKNLFDDETIQGAFKKLNNELKPNAELPEPDPEFRRSLSIALFFKAILHMAPEGRLSPKMKSGGAKLVRPVSSGIQDFETNKSLYPLTKAIPKIEALAQTSGQAQYIDDIPDHPNQLYAKFILAEAPPQSKIIKIDASKALNMDGIEKFLTKDDIPGDNNFYPAGMGASPPIIERILADCTVEYFHQPVGILVGSNRTSLDEAAKLVEIKYELTKNPPLLYIRDVLQSGSPDRIIKERVITAEDIGKDVQSTITGSFDIGSQYHFHMETQCCLAVPTEDGLDLFPSTQWIEINQVAAGRMLNIPHNKVNVTVRRCGGGFGAKINRNSLISCATALAAWLTKKPVRMSLTMKENTEIIGKRFPFASDYEVKVNNAGVIQHLRAKLYSDHGVGGNDKISAMLVFELLEANYGSKRFDIEYYRIRSDTPGNTWMRAPGSAEGLAFIESIMEHIAFELNMDPMDVRINNITEEKKLLDYLGDIKEWADIDQRKHDIQTFNQNNRWKKRGMSIVPMSWQFRAFGPVSVTVSIFRMDGSVSIIHGGIEIGQGVNTKAAQLCAYKFNIPMEKINIAPTNSVLSPNNFATGGSQTSEAVCYGVDKACDQLLERLHPFRTDASQTWEELISAAYGKFTHLTAIAQYSPFEPFVESYPVYGVCATEVEVDILTGQHLIRRVDLIEDVGISLSPDIDIGQIEGAFVMGQGYYTSEKIVFNSDGRQLTNNTWFYKPPGAKDIPIDFRVKLPKNNPNPKGVLQSKAVGEPPLCLSISVPLAIRHAVSSARQDADKSKSKYFLFDGPTTVENTFMNCLNAFEQYTL